MEMNPTILIITLLSFQIQAMFAQNISAELSITWETGYDILKKDSMVYVPKLHITYRNLSNTNLYFLKISNSRDRLPNIVCGMSIHPSFSNFEEYMRWRTDYLARAKEYGNYVNMNYNVRIGGMPLFNSNGWDVLNDTVDYHKEHMGDHINCDLENIYEYMYREKNSENETAKIYFTPSDVTPENILGAVKDQFVFLKPNEIYVDTYNLVGFKLVEGCFTFIINQSAFNSTFRL